MFVSNFIHVALSCGVVLCYTLIGRFFISFSAWRVPPKPKAPQEENVQEDQLNHHQSRHLQQSPDALHLIRLSNAFSPPGTQPSIFIRHRNLAGDNHTICSDDHDLDQIDTFSDVLEEPALLLRDSFEHGHSHRISIKPPACVHQASMAEIETGDHKSTLSEKRSSTTFAPEAHHHDNEKVNRLLSLITKGSDNKSRKKTPGYQHNTTCASEPNGTWSHFSDKRKKLFRPSMSALRRFNHSKQVHQVEHPKLSTNPNRIDYMNTVRTRFKLINSKRFTIKPANKVMSTNSDVQTSTLDSRRLSSTLFSSN